MRRRNGLNIPPLPKAIIRTVFLSACCVFVTISQVGILLKILWFALLGLQIWSLVRVIRKKNKEEIEEIVTEDSFMKELSALSEPIPEIIEDDNEDDWDSILKDYDEMNKENSEDEEE